MHPPGEDAHLLWLHSTLGTCGRATPKGELLGAIILESRSFKPILKPLLEQVVVGLLAVPGGLSQC